MNPSSYQTRIRDEVRFDPEAPEALDDWHDAALAALEAELFPVIKAILAIDTIERPC